MLWKLATLCLALMLALLFALAPPVLQGWQDRVFDQILTTPPAKGVIVVDIGAFDEKDQPWDRLATARLVEKLRAYAPKVIGFDMLFSGACDGPAAEALAWALQGTPVVMGFLLSDQPSPPMPPSQLALAGQVPLWSAPGAEAPCQRFGGSDLAAMVLMGDADAMVRRVPVGVAVAGRAYPGLAVAIAAKADGGMALATPIGLRLGKGPLLPTGNGNLRIRFSAPADWAGRTIQARDMLAGAVRVPKDAVILVGSSLPQRGGLRPTPASPVTPSVQIMADAVIALQTGDVPQRPGWAALAEAAFVAVTGLLGLALLRVSPSRAALVIGFVLILWAGGAVAAVRSGGLLIDPLLPAGAVAVAMLLAVTGRAADAARAERVLRARMGQLLPPALVTRIAAQPHLMRLEGDAREVTAFFTDIEGFSVATAEMGARDMVAALDAYFTLTCGIVLRHGGMIDKLVGDSIHALFNAPLDQPGHEAAALACAAEIIAATERFRAERGGFGRTRIGLECGPAVLGDVGFGTRIDYTAHGPAVNLAARLQEANKLFGTQICIGPTLAARLDGLTPLGETEIRSFGMVQLYTVTV